jgi:transitional endoplasmic reticulum ATPase
VDSGRGHGWPCRLGRRLDEPARLRILELLLEGRPVADVDVPRFARDTALFSGADLRSLVERAIDELIDEAIETAAEPPLTMRHLEFARHAMQPSTIEWLATARNYVEFANDGGRYDDVQTFLRSPEGRRAK